MTVGLFKLAGRDIYQTVECPDWLVLTVEESQDRIKLRAGGEHYLDGRHRGLFVEELNSPDIVDRLKDAVAVMVKNHSWHQWERDRMKHYAEEGVG